MALFKDNLIIPLAPITKKNNMQIVTNPKTKRPFLIASSQYREYEKKALLWLPTKYTFETIDYPVNLKCIYYMPTKRKVDLVNLLEATCDILVKAEILADDNSTIVVSHDGSKVLYDKENPRTEITIESIE